MELLCQVLKKKGGGCHRENTVSCMCTYEERINMEALQQSDAYTIFLEDMVMDEVVTPCNAIVSRDASLVNVGDYIELCSAYDQVSAKK